MRRRLTDLTIHPSTFAAAIETLSVWARGTTPRYVSTCTVYTLMRALEDERIFAALDGADMLTADGMPLVWLQRWQGARFAERVYGPDVMLALLERLSADTGVTHYFWGGLPGVPERLAAALAARFPNLRIVDIVSPPVADIGDQYDEALAERLNQSGASVIWLGLGSPKQDLWMAQYRPVLAAPLLIGVGAAFDFLSGTKPQAPKWMQRRGLEWLYRLLHEPRRLWKRYVIYNSRFLAAISRYWLSRSQFSQ